TTGHSEQAGKLSQGDSSLNAHFNSLNKAIQVHPVSRVQTLCDLVPISSSWKGLRTRDPLIQVFLVLIEMEHLQFDVIEPSRLLNLISQCEPRPKLVFSTFVRFLKSMALPESGLRPSSASILSECHQM